MKFNFRALCLGILFVLTATWGFSQAEHAKYYIEGNYEIVSINQQLIYKLYDIRSHNISFQQADTLYGHTTEDETVYFEFEKASTTHPDGFNQGLKFWRWQKKSQEWLEDSEIQNAEQSFSTNKVMSIVLILDCSKSIGSDFSAVQESAIKFVNTLSGKVSKNGNVHLGLIGFSTMKNTQVVVPLQPLNANSAPQIIQAINQMQLGNANGTALYYAMHQGVDMINRYVRQLKIGSNEVYDGSTIISFTDGYDNASLDPNIGLPQDDDDMLRTPYFNYLKSNVLNQKPNGKPMDSYLIAVKGKDANYNKADFEGAMQELSSTKENFYPVENFDLLQGEFQKIADALVDKWNNLKCFVPRSFAGRVRWTIGNEVEQTTRVAPARTEEKPTQPAKTRKKGDRLFWGIHTGAGFAAVATFKTGDHYINGLHIKDSYKGFTNFSFAIGADVGAWITPRWELGGYFTYNTPIMFSFGIQSLFGNPEAWGGIVGVGYNGGYNGHCPIHSNYAAAIQKQTCISNAMEVRVGAKYKNLYFFMNCAIGTYWKSRLSAPMGENGEAYIYGSGTGCLMTFNIAYNFSSLHKR